MRFHQIFLWGVINITAPKILPVNLTVAALLGFSTLSPTLHLPCMQNPALPHSLDSHESNKTKHTLVLYDIFHYETQNFRLILPSDLFSLGFPTNNFIHFSSFVILVSLRTIILSSFRIIKYRKINMYINQQDAQNSCD